jgi:hypothetical membrane protein
MHAWRTFWVRCGLVCGLVAPLWWAAMIVFCATQFPGYSHVTDFISELAARDAPTGALMRDAGFVLTGALYIAFAVALAWQFRAERMALLGSLLLACAGLARIAAGMWPCEPGCNAGPIPLLQAAHDRAASGAYAFTIAAAIAWGVAGQRVAKLRHLLALGIATATWCPTFLLLMALHPAWQGVFQRLASGVSSVWVLLLAVSAWRAFPALETASPAPSPTVRAGSTRRRPRRSKRRGSLS